MKGEIIIPKFYENLWGPTFKNTLGVRAPLWYALKERYGFNITFVDDVNVSRDTDLVLMFGVPYHNRPNLIPGLLDLNKNTKLIMWSGDLQCYGNKECLDNKVKVFNRCDVIISQTNEYFIEMYPQYLDKHEVMFHFFSPVSRYTNFKFNNTPKMRCLLSGSANKDVYVLRDFIIKGNSKYVDYHPPKFLGNEYAKKLHSYFCGVATSSIFNYVLAKHLEITAVGSLLLANETKDLEMAGFIPYKHYVPITKMNVFKKIIECVDNPNNYVDIRHSAMKFVRENHSLDNRVEQFEIILNKLFN